MNRIPVLLAADENYAMPLYVTMQSIVENIDEKTSVHFIVMLPEKYSDNTQNKFDDFFRVHGRHSVQYIEMHSAFSDVKMRIPHITTSTYYRLLASDLLPEWSKCVYMDVDIIVKSDLTQLYSIDIGNNYIAGVKAPGYHLDNFANDAHKAEIGLDDMSQYVNAGVLVLNLDAIRNDSLQERFVELSQKSFSSQDQDVINVACYGHIYHLPLAFNVMTSRIYDDDVLEQVFEVREIEDARSNPMIIHYATKVKPWNQLSGAFVPEWWSVCARTPYFREALGALAVEIEKTAESLSYVKRDRDYYKKMASAVQELESIKRSWSYRVGRAILWIPRKMRGVVRCYRENGFAYTVQQFFVTLKIGSGNRVKRDYEYFSKLPPQKYEKEVALWYKRTTGKKLNLRNPKTYNEKIQWLKLYDNTPLRTKLVDKYAVREWVEEKIGKEYLVPLLGVWDSFDEINFDELPEQFVLKANHGCGWNIIVKDKSKLDIEAARKKFNVWMRTNFAFRVGLELQYMHIPPKIIAEEYLENDNNDLYDYKVFCFAGKAESVMFLSERKQGLKMAFFDLNWNKLPFVYSYPRNEAEIEKPKNFELLIELSEKLAIGLPHVRVDFYILNDGSLKFGEMTFTSASGNCKWNPPEQDRIYGDMIRLPPKNPIPKKIK